MAVMEIVIKAQDKATEVVDRVKSKGSSAAKTLEKNWLAVGAATATAGAGIETMARKQAPLTEQTRNIASAMEMKEEEVRSMALSMSDATFPISDVLTLMETGRQQGIRSAEALKEYAEFWDTVGDATGENADRLAKSGSALRAVGVAAGEEKQALSAFGYVTRETSGDVSGFLRFIERTGPQIRDLGMDIDDAAAVTGALEHELGMSARTARSEFRKAVNESDGDINKMLDSLGLTEEQLEKYQEEVKDSSEVIEEQAETHAESYTLMQRLQSRAEDLMYQYGDLAEAASSLTPALIALGPAIKGISVAKAGVTRVATGAITAIKGLTVAKLALLAPIILIVGAIAGMIAIIRHLWQENEEFREFIIEVWERISAKAQEVWERIQEIIGTALDYINELIEEAVEWIEDFWEEHGEKIMETARNVWETIQEIVGTVLEVVGELIKSVMEWIGDFWEEHGENIIGIVQGMWDTIKGLFNIAYFLISGIIELLWTFIEWYWEKYGDRIIFLAKFMWDMVKGVFQTALDVLSAVLGGCLEIIRGVFDTFAGLFTGDWERMWEGLVGILRGIVNTIIGLINSVIGAAERMVNAIADAINRMPSFEIPSWVPLVGGNEYSIPNIPRASLPRIPKLHFGGTFKSSRPGGEDLALLRDGEKVITPEQKREEVKTVNIHVKEAPSGINTEKLAKLVVQLLRREDVREELDVAIWENENIKALLGTV